MQQSSPSSASLAAAPDRLGHIIDAAKRCFARTGFHRTTMQDVAAEAGMSPGNLYRYFPSKDALIAGIVEGNRAEMAADFERLRESEFDVVAGLAEIGRKHLLDDPREKALLCLEIWAEATRNPAIAVLNLEFEREMNRQFLAMFEKAKSCGKAPPNLDAESAAAILSRLADGLMLRRSLSPDFDAAKELGRALAVVHALLDGRVTFPTPEHSQESA